MALKDKLNLSFFQPKLFIRVEANNFSLFKSNVSLLWERNMRQIIQNRPNKNCGRQSLSACVNSRPSSTNFTWSITKYCAIFWATGKYKLILPVLVQINFV